MWSQFGVVMLLSAWGWLKLASMRWRIFFVLVIVFDFVYTVLLNVISLKITAFQLPTCIVLAILMGVGISHGLRTLKRSGRISSTMNGVVIAACTVIPFIPLSMNYGLCDQSRNYTAYEYAIDIFRTLGNGDVLFLEGDNNIFPVTYMRLGEKMREDVALFDRHGIIFKMPYLGDSSGKFYGNQKQLRAMLETHIIENTPPDGVSYAVFVPGSILLPNEFKLIPYGLIYRVVSKKRLEKTYKVENIWRYYARESFHDSFERDYLNRQICAQFYYRYGEYLFKTGQKGLALKYIRNASLIGYDDTGIHSILASLLADEDLHDEARQELEKALIYHGDLGEAHNNWGVCYYKLGDFNRALASLRKAIKIDSGNYLYYKNLAHVLHDSGRKNEAITAFERSLEIKSDQQDVIEFMQEHGLKY